MKKSLFGTDGIRGLANDHPMTPEMALSLGQAVAHFFKNAKSTNRIIIGKDTRRSSYMFENALAAGVCSMGSYAVLTGPLPTPAVAFLTKTMRADAGIMISASHNPFEDNGIKFFDSEGYKLSDQDESKIEEILKKLPNLKRPTGDKIGKAFRIEDATGRYIEFVKKTFPRDLTLDGLRIVIDCAHGSAYKIAPTMLWELGADVISHAVHPNGTNINERSGAVHPQAMARAVLETGADLGISLDGDADRVVMADETGHIIDGDKVLALCAIEMLNSGQLIGKKVVGTILTNMGVEKYLKSQGIDMIRTAVGDRYIIEAMRADNILLGGEPSGHLIFAEHATTGDGMIAALQVLANVVRTKKKLSNLTREIPLFPQLSKNIRVKEKKSLDTIPDFQDTIVQVEKRLNGFGRTVIRYSGTEPVLRLMVEGRDESVVRTALDDLCRVAEKTLV